MGRSRRSSFAFEKIEEKEELRGLDGKYIFAAGYCRLSVENDESNSIENQKRIIDGYLREHPEITLKGYYADDGVTGTTMDRPEWRKMMREAENGRIQCIIVKDLSRFGRNYVETGYYLEHIFPRMNVRFISCVDELDTEKMDDDMPIKIRNVINDMYARDVSRKMTNIFSRQRKNGELFKRPAYGYLLEKGKLVPDPATAPVVKMIFTWFEMGVSQTEIADRLTMLGVAPPRERDEEQFLPDDKTVQWSPPSLRNILKDKTMMGTYVSGKVIRRMHKAYQMAEDEWTMIPDHHEAIITKEQFEAVQKKIKDWKPRGENAYHEKLDGKLFCALCGSRLYLTKSYGKKYWRYSCFNHTGVNRRRKEYERLEKAPSLREDVLLEMVEDECRAFLKRYRKERKIIYGAEDIGGILEKPRAAVIAAKKDKEDAIRVRDAVIEAFDKGELDPQTYMILREKHTMICAEKEKILQEKLIRLSGMETAVQLAKNAMKGEGDPMDLVERIELHPDRSLTVRFKLDRIMETLKEA